MRYYNRSLCFYMWLIIFTLIFLSCNLAFADRAIANLDELVQEALIRNPDILASLQRWESAKAVIPQVQTFADPKVTIGYRDMVRQDAMYGLSQEIPFPG